MGWTTRQAKKEVEDLNNTINQIDLMDMYRTINPPTEYATSQGHV